MGDTPWWARLICIIIGCSIVCAVIHYLGDVPFFHHSLFGVFCFFGLIGLGACFIFSFGLGMKAPFE